MVESVMLWNEVNNPAHWLGGRPGQESWRVEDPGWRVAGELLASAASALAEVAPELERVFPGLAPMDPAFLTGAVGPDVLHLFNAVAGHNFWFDFGPASRLGESGLDALAETAEGFRGSAEALLDRRLPLVLSEIGVSSFSGDEIQALAAEKTLTELGRMIEHRPDTRATWYSLFDLPEEYLVTSRYDPESHGEVRHRKFGLYRKVDGRFQAKRAAETFARRSYPDRIGITQWFRTPWPDEARGVDEAAATEIELEALDAAPALLRELGVRWLRINITWCDWFYARRGEGPVGLEWFDRIVEALEEFRLIVTVFQAPPDLVVDRDRYEPGSVPRRDHVNDYRDTVVEIVRRYRTEPGGDSRSAESRS